MRFLILLILMFLSDRVWATEDQRYLEGNKVSFEDPQEADVLKVNTTLGFCTVLQFSEKPMLVSVGDNSLIQVEIPQNSQSVILKPLAQTGETNLFVYTPSQRFNYKVVIGAQAQADYVLDTKDSVPEKTKKQKKPTMEEVLKQARNYSILKNIKAINDRQLFRKDLFYSYDYPKLKVDFIEAFTNKNPNYLILHVVIHNLTNHTLTLIEKDTSLRIGHKKFTPQYIVFDANHLDKKNQTDGWLVLEDKFISIDNKFECGIGIEDIDDAQYANIS